jgi:hypothetical protein
MQSQKSTIIEVDNAILFVAIRDYFYKYNPSLFLKKKDLIFDIDEKIEEDQYIQKSNAIPKFDKYGRPLQLYFSNQRSSKIVRVYEENDKYYESLDEQKSEDLFIKYELIEKSLKTLKLKDLACIYYYLNKNIPVSNYDCRLKKFEKYLAQMNLRTRLQARDNSLKILITQLIIFENRA